VSVVSQAKLAIIGGTGELGFGLAVRWAQAGVPILIGSRETAKARDAAERVVQKLKGAATGNREQGIEPALSLPKGNRQQTEAEGSSRESSTLSVSGFENAQAAAQANVVVLTVPFPAQVPILKSIRGALKECIFVDATVPLAATLGGKATRILHVWQGSAAEQTREFVPAAIPVLAAFHNLSAEALQDPAVALDCDILVCGDDEPAKQKLFPLIKLIDGLRPIDAGPLEMARIVESLTALLISLNRRYKVDHCGIRITGLNPVP